MKCNDSIINRDLTILTRWPNGAFAVLCEAFRTRLLPGDRRLGRGGGPALGPRPGPPRWANFSPAKGALCSC